MTAEAPSVEALNGLSVSVLMKEMASSDRLVTGFPSQSNIRNRTSKVEGARVLIVTLSIFTQSFGWLRE